MREKWIIYWAFFRLDMQGQFKHLFQKLRYVFSLSVHMLCMIWSPYLIQRTSIIRHWNALFLKLSSPGLKTVFNRSSWYHRFLQTVIMKFGLVSCFLKLSERHIQLLFWMRLCADCNYLHSVLRKFCNRLDE